MRHLWLQLAAALVLSAFVTDAAHARPNRPGLGCSKTQIQSAKAAACMAQAESDILNGRPTMHVVYCSSTGKMLCCEVDGSDAIVDHSCSVIELRAPNSTLAPNAGTGGATRQ
jgi:hypothetical protein